MDEAALERYARLFHEQGRLTVNAERAKPFNVEDWDGRTPEQKEIDLRGVSAVAAEVLRDAGIDATALGLARRRLRRIAALCRDEPSGSIATGLILAVIGNEEKEAGHG